eukprot:TRINITY_DN59317_c0_g1_i1.p1 TRINITY_DN59317_c0_g1~~TRINITY_DN59317_c0_g1_i1.p1  ORF type:complete len:221 (-),score=35.86 TRINITY_DN59317_c0_g1_i1:23-685(-)
MGIRAVAHALQETERNASKSQSAEKRDPSKETNASKQTRNRGNNLRDVDEAPPIALQTYGWAEERLSKSAAIAAANWEHPEAYMDYVRRTTPPRRKKHRSAPPPERKRNSSQVARPPPAQGRAVQVALPQDPPPSLVAPNLFEKKLRIDFQHSQASTTDGSLQDGEDSPTLKLATSDRAVLRNKLAAMAAKPPMSAWGDEPGAPMGDVEKPPGKCSCALM